MVNEVEVMSWSDCHGAASSLAQSDVSLVKSLMDVDKAIDDGLPVGGGLGQLWEDNWEIVWNEVLQKQNSATVQ